MKRSFYEMLGVARNADQAQIDAAYALATERLNAEDVRGVAEAVNEAQLIRDGYQILSDPAERARYNAKLAASDAGLKFVFFPEDSVSRRKLGIETVVFAVLSAVFGAVVYAKLTQKTDEVLVEHKQAVARQRGEPNPPITTNAARPDTSNALRPDTPDAPRSDSENAKAGDEAQRR
jgi:DnaJ-class molecular chaperone